MSTGHVINRRLFSLRMSPGLASKSSVGIFLFGEKPELIFIHDTSVKEMHRDQAVSVFGAVSFKVNPQIYMSFPVEILKLTPTKTTFWMLMCDLMQGQ
ncbi:hypothetical protein TNCV_2147231 [Trichonephila clavipes]|uniref:Uncharacterized protein n=1 Tax=Trichonephila clavipes TaxID=2585209 RepID=A0A8X6VSM4_TRICX|nr:hypothetical protein TNCV_2147231 [Trichonephila clavipes]